MANISVQIDGSPLVSIDLADLTLVDVSVHGALDQASKADFAASGGNFEEGGKGYLIFVDRLALQAGQVVSVKFAEAGGSGDLGRTIAEMYPDEPACTRTDFTISEEMAAELRARPRLHDAFTAEAQISSGSRAIASSDERNTSFTFRVLWHAYSPAHARVHFTTNCLDDVLARQSGTTHLEQMLDIDGEARFTLLS